MATHFGSFATAFYAQTIYRFLAGNNTPRIYPPIGRGELGVMLASLNFSMTDGRGGMCPMCTDEYPCFLCSDELNWKEHINVEAEQTMVLRPVPSSDALRTWDIPGSAPLSSQPTHPAFCYKTGGEFYGSGMATALDSDIEAAIEPFDTSDVDELIAYYDKAKPQTVKKLPDEDEAGTAVDECLRSEEGAGSSRDNGPYD